MLDVNGKIRVGILFGGKSVEHEVSLQSARNILEAIDRTRYEPVLIGIDKAGRWHLRESSLFLLDSHDPSRIRLTEGQSTVTLVPWQEDPTRLLQLSSDGTPPRIDVVFPVLHGPLGEDGTVQGLFKLAGVPFVGAGVLGSAIAMDKEVSKRLLAANGIPVARWELLRQSEPVPAFEEIQLQLGLPFFLKPANSGSSVGVHKIRTENQFRSALRDAFQYDRKVLLEEAISGREMECSVLGNEKPMASVVGEVIPQREFYSYEAKYLDENGALLEVPANLPEAVSEEIRSLALTAFETLSCEGMARVDFFYSLERGIFVNEINSIPGFTRISMYPRLWQASGIPYPDLIDRLIRLAIERFESEKRLKTSYDP